MMDARRDERTHTPTHNTYIHTIGSHSHTQHNNRQQGDHHATTKSRHALAPGPAEPFICVVQGRRADARQWRTHTHTHKQQGRRAVLPEEQASGATANETREQRREARAMCCYKRCPKPCGHLSASSPDEWPLGAKQLNKRPTNRPVVVKPGVVDGVRHGNREIHHPLLLRLLLTLEHLVGVIGWCSLVDSLVVSCQGMHTHDCTGRGEDEAGGTAASTHTQLAA